ncbi:MAG: hypothetical protein EP332_10770 [Bacteroidetes bacterium]|nr:MAG: hypothetical protein EP332_10770 [Bacteroidota bacterium]
MKFLLSLILLLSALLTQAQVAVELPKMNVVYIGLDNPLNVVVQGVPREYMKIQSTGNCQVLDTNESYILRCRRRGDEKLLIVNSQTGDTLGERSVRVRSIPKPELRFGTLESGSHSRGAIMAQPGLYATLGEGFAYEGVKYVVDSALVILESFEATVVCKQKGTRTPLELRAAMRSDFTRLLVVEPYVTSIETDEHLLVSPLYITNRSLTAKAVAFFPSASWEKTIPELGQCISLMHDSIVYFEEGKRHLVISKRGKAGLPNDLLHTSDRDTVLHIAQGQYHSFYPANVRKEEGEVRFLSDTLFKANVEGVKMLLAAGIELASIPYSVEMKLDHHYYPVGEWKYYYPNGKLKAQGTYSIDGVFDNDTWSFEDYSPTTLQIKRTGIWYFFNDQGELVEKINYDK